MCTKKKLLIAATGSVATIKLMGLVEALHADYEVWTGRGLVM